MSKSRKTLAVLLVLLLAALIAVCILVLRKKTPVEAVSEAGMVRDVQSTASAAGKKARGWIEVKGADFLGHEVREAATGAKVATIDSLESTLPLPAGTYDVGFGATFWKGVTVREGETTVLVPGGLTLNHASLEGHDVVAAAGGAVQGRLSATNSHLVLVPGTYAVKFGPLSWTAEVAAGETAILDPGIIEVAGADIRGHLIFDSAGKLVGDVSATRSSLPLPPGEYTIELDGKNVPFALEAGKTVRLERR